MYRRLGVLPVTLIVWVFLATMAIPARAASGDLDPAFGGDGMVTTRFKGAGEYASAIAIQANGKIVSAGTADLYGKDPKFALTRYNRDGTLDPTFGRGGRVTTDFTSKDAYPKSYYGDGASAVAIQSDGKIVAAGQRGFKGKFALARYNPNGRLDTSFGLDGKVTTLFGSSPSGASAVAILSNGRIVAAGSAGPYDSSKFALVRYNRNGTLDTSFSRDGKVMTRFGTSSAHASDVAIQADGKIVGVGSVGDYPNRKFALVRYRRDGTLDTSFGGDGRVTTAFPGGSAASAAAIGPGGQIVAAGADGLADDNPDFAVARYEPSGSLDTSFDGDGKVTTGFPDDIYDAADDVAVQSDGKIVTAGYGEAWFGGAGDFPGDFALVRYKSDGSLDPSFGGIGMVTTRFPGWDGSSAAGVAIQSNGKIVAAGSVQNWYESHPFEFALARYQAG